MSIKFNYKHVSYVKKKILARSKIHNSLIPNKSNVKPPRGIILYQAKTWDSL